MKKLLLLLLFCSPLLQAAEWLRWQNVGQATLTWGPFTVYDSQLLTPDGRWQPQQWPLALVITYRRDISRQELLDATLEQWQAQNTGSREQQQQWLQQLAKVWPNVSDGSRLAFQAEGNGGQFYWQPAGTQAAITAIGPRFDAAFRDAFLNIWLSPDTTYPDIRRELTGG
ncbi:hypothetical protein [Erwinia sorbitola]|uniref:Chalcone isomerase domain-containing protein n=1 Tax=Erwinia sorbitola TaxID=2681984 RepID=A0A6I6EI63_9GAMM|nr:hypothetical protein [Erwinia sorbitola]MTD26719.1 hypothetical protein [Erwinia sorbitola]QGU88288.1 hypothetical protein GN242_14105 [Erwinia sorbitola]